MVESIKEFGINYADIQKHIDGYVAERANSIDNGDEDAVQASITAQIARCNEDILKFRNDPRFAAVCDLQIQAAEANGDAETAKLWRDLKEGKNVSLPFNQDPIATVRKKYDDKIFGDNEMKALEDLNTNAGLALQRRMLESAMTQYDRLGAEGKDLLIPAAKAGKKEEVKLLLDAGADVNAQNVHKDTALIWASINGHKDVVAELLTREGINVNLQNQYGETALTFAADKGHKEIVEALLAKEGINVNLQNQHGETALTLAADKGRKEIVEALLAKEGINVNLQNQHGETALSLAVYKGRKEIVDALLAKEGINVNLQNQHGTTALMLACGKNGSLEMAQKLVEKGANLELANKNGYTALSYAVGWGRADVAKFLIEKGANVNVVNTYEKDGQQHKETLLMGAIRCRQGDKKELMDLLLAQDYSNLPDDMKQAQWAALQEWAKDNPDRQAQLEANRAKLGGPVQGGEGRGGEGQGGQGGEGQGGEGQGGEGQGDEGQGGTSQPQKGYKEGAYGHAQRRLRARYGTKNMRANMEAMAKAGHLPNGEKDINIQLYKLQQLCLLAAGSTDIKDENGNTISVREYLGGMSPQQLAAQLRKGNLKPEDLQKLATAMTKAERLIDSHGYMVAQIPGHEAGGSYKPSSDTNAYLASMGRKVPEDSGGSGMSGMDDGARTV